MNEQIYDFAYLVLGSIATLKPSQHKLAREIHSRGDGWKVFKVVRDDDLLLYTLSSSWSIGGRHSEFGFATLEDIGKIPIEYYEAMIPPQINEVPYLELKCTQRVRDVKELEKGEKPIYLGKNFILGFNEKSFDNYLPYPRVQNPHIEYKNRGRYFENSPKNIEEGIKRLEHLESKFSDKLQTTLLNFLEDYKYLANKTQKEGLEKEKVHYYRWRE